MSADASVSLPGKSLRSLSRQLHARAGVGEAAAAEPNFGHVLRRAVLTHGRRAAKASALLSRVRLSSRANGMPATTTVPSKKNIHHAAWPATTVHTVIVTANRASRKGQRFAFVQSATPLPNKRTSWRPPPVP